MEGRDATRDRSKRGTAVSLRFQVSGGGSGENGRRFLIGEIVVECCCDCEEGIRSNPEEREAAVRLIVQRYTDKAHPSNSNAS